MELKRSSRNIKEIIVHCTATKEGQSFTVEDIRKWHKVQGWQDIGYHYVVYLDGSIHEGRDIDISGAHCQGHNSISIGVVYIGGLDSSGKPKDTRTPEQKEALFFMMQALKVLYPNAHIYPHNKFANKACPCFDVEEEYKDL